MTLAANSAPSRGEVLVVEDTPSSLKLLSDLLTGAGYTVRQAPNGELALWTVETALPDLILLDINMPEMDGFEVCRRLKARPETASVPVMFLSAQSDIEDVLSGLALGAVDYVVKPYVAEEVLARVHTHVSLAQVTRALQQERETLEQRVGQRTTELQEMMDSLRQEIHVRQTAEAQLKLAGTVFEASFDAILVMGPDRCIQLSNPAFARLTGYEPAEAQGQLLTLLESNKSSHGFFDELWETVTSSGYWTGEIWLRHKDHNVFPALCTLTAARDASGAITHVIALLLSVAERRDTETLVNFLSHHDPLTGMPNRMTAIANFERHLADLVGDENEVAVLYLGLDRFKQISDLMGHAAGDRVLQVVSGMISECLFAGDIAYRQGGDEFVILRTDSPGLPRTQELVHKLIAELHTEFDIDEGRASISASIGIASAPHAEATLVDLVRNAGTALSWVQKEGSNGFAFFARDMDSAVRKHYEIEVGLREALAKNHLQLYYQPQIDLNSGEMAGVEALLRWKDPERGFISPGVFIPVAEQTGQILAIGEWVLEDVCQQIKRWREQGVHCPKVAVNFSSRQFQQFGFSDFIARTIGKHGVDPALIEVEITEGAMVQDVEQTIETLDQLKLLGVKVSVDDFGTGYSSLSYLKNFPVDVLKIDQSFIRDMRGDTAAKAIVLSIISLAHNLGLKVIAEGVEERDELLFLHEHGCDEMQGYYFSKPIPPETLRELIVRGTRLNFQELLRA